MTPNDAFFVRYHLTHSPPDPQELDPERFRLQLGGNVKQPLSFSVSDLKNQFESVAITAVNQCSGNSRAFFEPRVPGGQLGNGAMGNARWRGVRLRDILQKAGLNEKSRQVTFNGLDRALVPQTPDFVKALDIDHALDGEVLLAFEMNGTDLPWLNGYPLRLVVPGYYGTYWMKHVSNITVTTEVFDGYWMSTGYRIPANECACVPPGTTPQNTIPIGRLNVRSFITSPADGAKVNLNQEIRIRGIAFDGGFGIREVLLSTDGGNTWKATDLGEDLGRYSFREWSTGFSPKLKGPIHLKVKATNRIGQSQSTEALWNPAGYMRNVVENIRIDAV